MSYELFPISNKAKERLEAGIDKRAKYPWHTCSVGQSFAVDHNTIKLTSLRSLADRTGKRINKKFIVIDHGANAGYEVACIK